MKTQFRNVLFGFTEHFWAAGFALAGRVQRPRVREWHSPGGQHVLALAPHPDDEVAGCGGTLVRHHQAGDTTHLVYVTDGRGSRAGGLSPDDMAHRRASEARESARLLKVSEMTYLGLRENEWEASTLVPLLKNMFERFPIALLYAPSRVDFHPEHHQVAHSLGLALASFPDILVRVYSLHVPLASLVNVICPIAHVTAIRRAALSAHATQWGSTERVLRMWHYAAAYFGVPVEGFWEMPAQMYVRLHQAPLPWPTHHFRGIRARPFSDPLAYWVGASIRKTLHR